jgi:membrane-associated phospholipid phosphatase
LQKSSLKSRHLNAFLVPYIIFLLAVSLVKTGYSKEQIYFFVNGMHSTVADVFFRYVTELGSGAMAVAACVLLLFVSYRSSLLMVSSLLLSTLINVPLKYLFQAPRPSLYFASQHRSIRLVPHIEMMSNNLSFPSGHTVCAFTMAVVFTYIVPRKAYGGLFCFLALLVGYSRMYLSQHFLEDVTAGAVVGTLVTMLWLSLAEKSNFFNNPRLNGSLLRKSS